MAELGRINPEKRMACPDCRKVLPDWDVEDFERKPRCPSCGTRVSLPEAVLQKMRESQFLGNNLDLMG